MSGIDRSFLETTSAHKMLNWSDGKYKMTLGLGVLGMAGLMAELWQPTLSVWCMLVIALFPLTVFIFIHPGEMNARVVRYAQRAASVWYLTVAVALMTALLMSAKLPQGWAFYQVFIFIARFLAALSCSVAAREKPGAEQALAMFGRGVLR